MIFVTVGTQFNFDRLINALDKLADKGQITEDIFAQIGPAKYIPENFEYVRSLDKEQFEQKIKHANAVISHAGMGSITTALSYNKPLLVIPRLKKYGELVNDHQRETAKKFQQLGHILAAYSTEELPEKINQLKDFKPKNRQAQPKQLIQQINTYLDNLQSSFDKKQKYIS